MMDLKVNNPMERLKSQNKRKTRNILIILAILITSWAIVIKVNNRVFRTNQTEGYDQEIYIPEYTEVEQTVEIPVIPENHLDEFTTPTGGLDVRCRINGGTPFTIGNIQTTPNTLFTAMFSVDCYENKRLKFEIKNKSEGNYNIDQVEYINGVPKTWFLSLVPIACTFPGVIAVEDRQYFTIEPGMVLDLPAVRAESDNVWICIRGY